MKVPLKTVWACSYQDFLTSPGSPVHCIAPVRAAQFTHVSIPRSFLNFFFDLHKNSHHSIIQFLTRGQVYSKSNILYLSACVSPDRFGLIRSSGSQVLGWVLLIKCAQTGDDKYCEHEPLKTRQRDDWIKSGIWRTQWGDGEWEMGVMRADGGVKSQKEVKGGG